MGDANKNKKPTVTHTYQFGSAGGSMEADATKPVIEKAHSDIVAYLKQAEQSGAIKIPADKSAEVYQGLHDKVVGSDEYWRRVDLDVSRFGSASAGIMADIMDDHVAGIENAAKKFVEEQIAVGNIELNGGEKVFFVKLSIASTKSLGGKGKA